MIEKILLGFFVGALCGIVPLIYGFIKHRRLLGICGITFCSLAGLLFSVLGKSPFTALVVAILFVLIIIASNKRNSHHDNDEDNFDNDIT